MLAILFFFLFSLIMQIASYSFVFACWFKSIDNCIIQMGVFLLKSNQVFFLSKYSETLPEKDKAVFSQHLTS